MIKRYPRRLKTPWMSNPPLDLPPPMFQEICPFLDALGLIAFFPSLRPIQRENQRTHIPMWFKRQVEIDMLTWLLLWFSNFFLPLILFGAMGLCQRAHTPLFSPFSNNGEGVFSWAFALLGPASSFLFIVFFLVFHGEAFATSLHHVLDALNLFIKKLLTNHGLT